MLPANREAGKVGLEDVSFYWVQSEVKIGARPRRKFVEFVGKGMILQNQILVGFNSIYSIHWL